MEAKQPPKKISSPLDREQPSLEGWLWKLGENRQAWKKRWFALVRNRLYYLERKGAPPINFIFLDGQTVADWQTEKCSSRATRECSFKLQLPYTHRIYYLSAESRLVADSWMVAIQDEIESASEQPRQHVDLSRFIITEKAVTFPVLDVLLQPVVFDPSFQGAGKKARYILQMGTSEVKTSAYPYDTKHSHFPLNADCTFPVPAGDLHVTVQDEKKAALATVVIVESDWQNNSKQVLEFPSGLGLVRVQLHHTTSTAVDALLFSRGLPMRSLPLRVDAGDILLFSSHHILSYGAKLFTMSEWDHVGLIVRWFNQSLRIFEATGDGVGLYDVDARVREVMSTTKLAVRRLQHERSEELLDRLYEFIRATKGRPFKKNLLELAKAAGAMQNKEDMSSLFCSQLCAAGYQAMGLLSSLKPSNQYLPRDWATRSTQETMPRCTGKVWELEPKITFRNVKPVPMPRLESAGRSPLRSPRGQSNEPPRSPRAQLDSPSSPRGPGSHPTPITSLSATRKENTLSPPGSDPKSPLPSPRARASASLSNSMPLLPSPAPAPSPAAASPQQPAVATPALHPPATGLSKSQPAVTTWAGPTRRVAGIRLGSSRLPEDSDTTKPMTAAEKVSREEKKLIRRMSRQSVQAPPPELDVMKLLAAGEG